MNPKDQISEEIRVGIEEVTEKKGIKKLVIAGLFRNIMNLVNLSIVSDVMMNDDLEAIGLKKTLTIPSNVVAILQDTFQNENFTGLILPEGLLRIDSSSFSDNKLGLDGNDLTIPSTVTLIGEYAFSNNKLKNVLFAENSQIKTIAEGAFDSNPITTLSLPEGLETLGSLYLPNLTEIHLPSTLITFGGLNGSEITEITLPNNISEMPNLGNNKLTNITFPNSITDLKGLSGNNFTSYEVPTNITKVLFQAMNRNNLATLILHNAITSIGNEAFAQNAIISLSLPTNLQQLGDWAFAQNSISEIEVPGTLTNFNFNSFEYNPLEVLVINEGVSTLSNSEIFIASLKNISIPQSVTSEPTFTNHLQLLQVTYLPISVSNNAFWGCENLSEITLGNTETIGSKAFQSCNFQTFALPTSVTTIGSEAFKGNQLAAITLHEGITSIGNWAFAENNISEVMLPSTLATANISAFANNPITKVTIKEGVTAIVNLTNILHTIVEFIMPSTVSSVSGELKHSSTLTTVTDKRANIDSIYANAANLATFNAPNVETIANKAFENTAITSFNFREGITTIGIEAFKGSSLESASLPSTITSIKDYAFQNCQIATLTFPNINGSKFPYKAFTNNPLHTLVIEEGVTEIEGLKTTFMGSDIFSPFTPADYPNLANVTIPSTCEQETMFKDFEPIRVANMASNLGETMFKNSGLTTLTISEGVTTIGHQSCRGCTNLTSVTFPSTLTDIAEYAFENCGLTEVTLPSGCNVAANAFDAGVTINYV